MQLRQLPTTELTPHPILSRMPDTDTDAPEFRALLAAIAEGGIAAAGRNIITNSFRVVDNADVWIAAKTLGLKTVPTAEVEMLDIPLTIVAGIAARPNYTKGQIAYLAAPFCEDILKASRKRREINLQRGRETKKGQNPDGALSAPSESKTLAVLSFRAAKNAEEIADCLGISLRLFRYAAAIHREFEADPSLKDKFEPLILDQEEDGATCGLGAVIAGIGGHKATRGQTPMIQPELDLWGARVSKMFSPTKWHALDKVSAEVRAAIAERAAKELFDTCPEEVVAAVEIAAARRLGVKVPLRAVS